MDHVEFWRKLVAFPNIYRPCLARDSATFIRFGLCNIRQRGLDKKESEIDLQEADRCRPGVNLTRVPHK